MRELMVLAGFVVAIFLLVESSKFLGRKMSENQAEKMRVEQIESTQKGLDRQAEFIAEQKRLQELERLKESETNGTAQKQPDLPEFNTNGASEGTGSACDGNP